MAKATVKPKVTVNVQFEINEDEARALGALAGYGDDPFIKVFYEKMGKSYLEPHEAGLRSFLQSIRDIINPAITEVNEARRFLEKRKTSGK